MDKYRQPPSEKASSAMIHHSVDRLSSGTIASTIRWARHSPVSCFVRGEENFIQKSCEVCGLLPRFETFTRVKIFLLSASEGCVGLADGQCPEVSGSTVGSDGESTASSTGDWSALAHRRFISSLCPRYFRFS